MSRHISSDTHVNKLTPSDVDLGLLRSGDVEADMVDLPFPAASRYCEDEADGSWRPCLDVSWRSIVLNAVVTSMSCPSSTLTSVTVYRVSYPVCVKILGSEQVNSGIVQARHEFKIATHYLSMPRNKTTGVCLKSSLWLLLLLLTEQTFESNKECSSQTTLQPHPLPSPVILTYTCAPESAMMRTTNESTFIHCNLGHCGYS